ncbi:inovirus-type Gp2 protein [Mariprofundus sp. KV]|uniref:YagK/YfjJ domain-containing protein n=1 Tax=Mariprofundus sp. KV TaxID=2608715 RepID=UPI0015A3A86F|nr:inovirus-type Gp2 protein [Mariprofundus sp. KV]NWF37511.1 inovirus Gp2 family protein [Mariprofundus sp. KV]
MNRKTISYSEQFEFGGVTYKVNVTKRSGVYREVMRKVLEQLSIARKKHGRLLVVRFDLHSFAFDSNSLMVSQFRNQIIQWIKRNYKTKDVGFVWVREQERSKHQHYHFALFIDGDKIRHSKKLLEAIADKWEHVDHHNNHMPVIPKPFYFVDNDSVFADAVYRLSYLAKQRGKGHRPDQAKDYSTSRLK